VERWGYERLEEAGVRVGDEIFSAGSAATSPVLSQLRANIMNRRVVRTAAPTASLGAAILAAATVFYGGNLIEAMGAMTRVVECFEPGRDPVGRWESVYHAFREACSRHGFD